MPDIPAGELRNDVTAVLRRTEAGERLRVTVSGRPVAELVPLSSRPMAVAWHELVDRLSLNVPDTPLAAQLRDLISETTDDAP